MVNLNLQKMLLCYRHEMRLTVRELAAIIGISPTSLSRFERGLDIGGNTVVRIVQWALQEEKK